MSGRGAAGATTAQRHATTTQPREATDGRDDDREHDLVVFGATGFVGRLLAAELAHQAPPHLRIALVGRDEARLQDVRASLPGEARHWPLVVADSTDDAALDRLARSTRVVVTTVGPYSRYGFGLARACAEAGTHYADLTGEVLYVRRLVDELHQTAERTGARLVTSCGFDSVPSDLGVLLLHERAKADGAGDLCDTTLLVRRMRGGVSGGTVDSMRVMIAEAASDPAARKVVLDPYALSPDRAGEPSLGRQRDAGGAMRDHQTGQWTAPFVMASFNTRIVRRSNALTGHSYGRRFRYRELMACGRGRAGQLRAAAVSAGIGALVVGMANPLTRPLLGRLLPSPGEGPSEEVRRRGCFRMEVRTTTSSGRRYLAVVAAQGDPGYAATAVMLAESALCLVEDGARLPARAGVLTPATAFGDVLVERLRRRDFTLTVDEEPARRDQGSRSTVA